MNKIVKRMINMFVAGAMALSLLTPVTEVSAASRNPSKTNASLCSVTKN